MSSGNLLRVFLVQIFCDSAIVNKIVQEVALAFPPHFPSREIALVVENNLKPHE